MKQKLLIVLLLTLVSATSPHALIHTQSTGVVRPLQGAEATAPPVGQAVAGAVRFVAIGDTGTGGKDQRAIAHQMVSYHKARPYDTVIMLGDNIYPSGSSADLPKKFEQPYAELLQRGVRFYAALGNHDVQQGRQVQTNYRLFNMGGRNYYSFTKGDDLVEFFVLDSTDMDAAQLRWLEGALMASRARWKVAYFHHPIYSSGERHGSSAKLRACLEPLFVRYGVAAVFSGHDHFYERIKPQRGVQYFVCGASGKLRRGNINRRSSLFAAGNDSVHSFLYVEVTHDQLSFWAVDAAGRLLDHGALVPPVLNRVIGSRRSQDR